MDADSWSTLELDHDAAVIIVSRPCPPRPCYDSYSLWLVVLSPADTYLGVLFWLLLHGHCALSPSPILSFCRTSIIPSDLCPYTYIIAAIQSGRHYRYHLAYLLQNLIRSLQEKIRVWSLPRSQDSFLRCMPSRCITHRRGYRLVMPDAVGDIVEGQTAPIPAVQTEFLILGFTSMERNLLEQIMVEMPAHCTRRTGSELASLYSSHYLQTGSNLQSNYITQAEV